MYLLFSLAYITGGFHLESITKEKGILMQTFLPQIEKEMKSEGFNVTLKNGTIDEWWTQIVNGKNHAIKMSYESVPNSICVMLHEPFDHNITLVNVGLCAFNFLERIRS